MKKTIDNNYELYTKKTSGTASIILDSSTNTTKSNINLRADGIIEKSYNNSKKYYGGNIVPNLGGGTYTMVLIDVPTYSSISVRCNFNVYKNFYGTTDYSYTSEKNALFVRGASGNISQIGATSNIFENSNFPSYNSIPSVLGKIIVNGTKVSITLDIPSIIGEYSVGNVVGQVNYEYIITTNTDTSEASWGGIY